MFLTRTDLFWAPVFTTLVIFARYRMAAPTLVNVGLSCALILPYLAWNHIFFGALVPISGRVKSFYLETAFPTLAEYLASDERTGLQTLFLDIWGNRSVLLVGLSILALALRRSGSGSRPRCGFSQASACSTWPIFSSFIAS